MSYAKASDFSIVISNHGRFDMDDTDGQTLESLDAAVRGASDAADSASPSGMNL